MRPDAVGRPRSAARMAWRTVLGVGSRTSAERGGAIVAAGLNRSAGWPRRRGPAAVPFV
jgi:hypothetical protein